MTLSSTDPLVRTLLPHPTPVRLVEPDGTASRRHGAYRRPHPSALADGWARMVLARRFNVQATALARQGRLAVYPSSRGQEACQVGAALALRESDWLFPTYRDAASIVARGVDPAEVLVEFRGDWHCGYDPVATKVAPQVTPLATNLAHAVGLAHALRLRHEPAVVLALVGDGATSEGDFHEALNLAGVLAAPVVFLVQNNGFAISVPLAKQTAAPGIAYRGIGYGLAAEQVDGNDLAAVLSVLTAAFDHARSGAGPYLVEAMTYRMEAHTNADDDRRYRAGGEVEEWEAADPLRRAEAYLRAHHGLDHAAVQAAGDRAEAMAAAMRAWAGTEPVVDPLAIFDHVFARRTPQLDEQRAQVAAELEAAS